MTLLRADQAKVEWTADKKQWHVEITVGAEVIKPLATPVLGGMLSSLVHVLIVTPVIFLWLRERELRKTLIQGDEK